MIWVPDMGTARDWARHGFTTFVVGSEHAWIVQGVRSVMADLRALG